ncbi:TniB family NTP-binding protein [Paenibacillus filicis]|uniref:TniB family NTP-binding protein n=1 Tax=Paenibacillus gyeongsangnamensis TaxID=3388067 RepID=A0ABT4QBS8_9BACL|nr:TniB family NTP-binding protein [Paenibacillus filicis]MCZ8514344.1 TniB family NTP-binding protein [Paenibacillus filicis]
MNSNTYNRLEGNPIEEQELKQRLNDFDKIVVHHKLFQDLYQAVRECHVLKRGVVILGDTGAGKSTLFKTYERDFQRKTKVRVRNKHEENYESVPVLRVELDSNSKPLNVASKMLEELGDPFHYKGTEKQLTSRLKAHLIDAEVELIIIDELQHLIDTDTQRVIRKAADWLKQLLNDVNLPIVFGGIKEDANRIFASNKQLDERFPHKATFDGFMYRTEEEKREFRAFLKSIDYKMPFPDRSHIYDPLLAEKIYYATLGIPRTLNHLFHHSIKFALKQGMDTLAEMHLEYGFSLLSFETRPKVRNPFDGKAFDLKVALENEKTSKGV